MSRLLHRGIQFGIWWASDPQRALATVGVVWLNTLKGPLGNWSRTMTWGITKGTIRAGIAGLAFTARTTWSRLLVPVAVWASPVLVPVAVGAGVLVTAGVISGGVVAAQQEVGLVGPDAPTMAGDPRWFHGLEMNPFMFSMGTVV